MARTDLQPYQERLETYFGPLVANAAQSGDGCSVTIYPSPEGDPVRPDDRITVYALAYVLNVRLVDFDPSPAPPFPPGLLDQARAYVYRVDPSRRPPNRTAQGLELVAKLILAAVVSVPGWLVLSLLLACFGWGFDTVIGGAWRVILQAVAWVRGNPSEAAFYVRTACKFAAIGLPIFTFLAWMGRPYSPPRPVSNDNGFGPRAARDFTEASAYGDAQLAERNSIQRALNGHNVAAPKFED